MSESSTRRAALQQRIDRLSRPARASGGDGVATGHAGIDRALGGGLARGRLHEIVAEATEDAASAAGFAGMCARRFGGTLIWLRVARRDHGLHPHGLREIGIDPRAVLLVSAPDPPAVLRAADEVMRCDAVGVAVIELWREPHRVDLTASRRLMLAAEASGATALLLRVGAMPVPGAAQTRWGVRAAPSVPLAAGAPGGPMLDIALLRQRGGMAGGQWLVEWDRDAGCFRAPLSGAVAALPVGRPMDGGAEGGWRRAG